MNRKNIILTCDTEALEFPFSFDAPGRNIFGREVGATASGAGIERIMDICDEFGVKMHFFYDVFTEYNALGTNKLVADCVLTRGHHLSLHAHIEHLGDLWWHQRGYEAPTWAANYFDHVAAALVYEDAVRLFKIAAGFTPLAFRAGSWRYCRQTLEAIYSHGIKLSFNYYPLTSIRTSFPHGPDAGVIDVFRWSNGLIEVPATCIRGPTFFSKNQKYIGFESHMFKSRSDYFEFLEALEAKHPLISNIVLTLHSWSLMDKVEGRYSQHSQMKENAFYEFIKGAVEKYNFLDLDAKSCPLLNCSDLMCVPIIFAGEGGSPLKGIN